MSFATYARIGLESDKAVAHSVCVTRSGDDRAVTPSPAGGRCPETTTAGAGDPISTACRPAAASG
jgi:hypothetical protein